MKKMLIVLLVLVVVGGGFWAWTIYRQPKIVAKEFRNNQSVREMYFQSGDLFSTEHPS